MRVFVWCFAVVVFSGCKASGVVGVSESPSITSVSGDASNGRIASGLVIAGAGLATARAVRLLSSAGEMIGDLVIGTASASTVTASIPPTIVPAIKAANAATLILEVQTSVGVARQSVQILQGQDGAPGVQGTQGLQGVPGAPAVTDRFCLDECAPSMRCDAVLGSEATCALKSNPASQSFALVNTASSPRTLRFKLAIKCSLGKSPTASIAAPGYLMTLRTVGDVSAEAFLEQSLPIIPVGNFYTNSYSEVEFAFTAGESKTFELVLFASSFFADGDTLRCDPSVRGEWLN